MTPNCDAVLWDVGNVLVRWDPRAALDLDDAAWAQFAPVFAQLNHAADSGVARADQLAQLQAQGSPWAAPYGQYVAHMQRSLLGHVPGTAQLVARLRAAGVPQVVISNWPRGEFHLAYAVAPELADMDGVVTSGQEGVAKPDPRLFQIALERYHLVPERTLFVDDMAANIAAGAALGLRTHLFRTAHALAEDLAAAGLLPEA